MEDSSIVKYTAKHKFAVISAQKVRPFANLIRGQYADDAMNILKAYPNRGARLVEKVLKSAMANAEDRNEPDPENDTDEAIKELADWIIVNAISH